MVVVGRARCQTERRAKHTIVKTYHMLCGITKYSTIVVCPVSQLIDARGEGPAAVNGGNYPKGKVIIKRAQTADHVIARSQHPVS